ncbi:hypothetical protein BDP55DRAFT_671702 [Colletotrichum godetiae]|uniref:Uncharacterized protein n=1 Tax=Colletotrichum godetiae TaxID=1209918 RepID=A0AAJ0AFM4_9PEZI|nr:uncharacterized protein BDP55DRAFT_671702 [Colletotrichum godetiae]KAK1673016.1 hypothetical protein BDP55DRAFT_671702 [Colletotrichum godetiae]
MAKISKIRQKLSGAQPRFERGASPIQALLKGFYTRRANHTSRPLGLILFDEGFPTQVCLKTRGRQPTTAEANNGERSSLSLELGDNAGYLSSTRQAQRTDFISRHHIASKDEADNLPSTIAHRRGEFRITNALLHKLQDNHRQASFSSCAKAKPTHPPARRLHRKSQASSSQKTTRPRPSRTAATPNPPPNLSLHASVGQPANQPYRSRLFPTSGTPTNGIDLT